MGLKSFNPYTASRRFMTVLDKSHITKETPEKVFWNRKSAPADATTRARFRYGTAVAVTRSSIAD
jgi:ribosomal protein L2